MVDLGHANVSLSAQFQGRAQGVYHDFVIEESRRPEYEVNLVTDAATHFVGDTPSVRTEARYYTGGGLAGADTHVQVSAARAQFAPPNRGDYSFGESIWRFWDARGYSTPDEPTRELHTVTDARGNAAFEIATTRADPAYPHTLHLATTVQDVNRQAWSDSMSLLVHPDTYVGLRLQRAFVSQGEALEVDATKSSPASVDGSSRRPQTSGMARSPRPSCFCSVRSADFTNGAWTRPGSCRTLPRRWNVPTKRPCRTLTR